jgi:hypothetical protein
VAGEVVEDKKEEEETKSTGSVFRVWPFFMQNKCMFFISIVLSLVDGFIMPTFGIFFAHIIASLIQLKNDPAFY